MTERIESIFNRKCRCGTEMIRKGSFRYGKEPYFECPKCGNIIPMIYYD